MTRTLVELRQALGLTQVDLARRCSLRQASVSAIESGLSRPRRATVGRLAAALNTSVDEVWKALTATEAVARTTRGEESGWAFLEGLDQDLAQGLMRELVARWTHSSTAIEGNTLTLADTMFVLSEGLTISGKSVSEHAEVHGHAQAIQLLERLCAKGYSVSLQDIHDLHRAVQTAVVHDVLAPVGRWKSQPNGTMALQSTGEPAWHDYALPHHVPELMSQWLERLKAHLAAVEKSPASADKRQRAFKAYSELHIAFASIHPYADGNGRMARLIANVPVLRAGLPPLLIDAKERRRYLTLAGDVSVSLGQPAPGGSLVPRTRAVQKMRTFFEEMWLPTLELVDTYRKRQQGRHQTTP